MFLEPLCDLLHDVVSLEVTLARLFVLALLATQLRDVLDELGYGDGGTHRKLVCGTVPDWIFD